MANRVRYPPPFLSVSPLESMQSGGAIPPLRRGISAILARYPMKTRQMGAMPPSAILSRKGIARYGGVSRTGPLSLQPGPRARRASVRFWDDEVGHCGMDGHHLHATESDVDWWHEVQKVSGSKDVHYLKLDLADLASVKAGPDVSQWGGGKVKKT